MKFRTQSGSVYELDHDSKSVRRLTGNNDPTPRIADGEWRTYEDISDVIVGYQVVILWPNNVALLPESPLNARPYTITSRVTEIF